MEIKVSELAVKKINEVVKQNNEQSILRIYVEKASCSSARFGIAFDNVKDNDEITEAYGIKFITDKQYMPKYSNGINIDYVISPKEGFIIASLNPITKGCTGCTGCGH